METLEIHCFILMPSLVADTLNHILKSHCAHKKSNNDFVLNKDTEIMKRES